MKTYFSIRNVYFFGVISIFVYLILRAIYVPPVHDESTTFIYYIQSDQWMPYAAHWDANNHVINSCFSAQIFKIFGFSWFSIRLASLLSFLIFAFYVYKIGIQLKSTIVRIGFLFGMITVHNLMEYFAYTRGYAMSMAFLMGGIFYMMQYFRNFELKKLWPFYLFSFLALFANLTLFNTMVIANGFLFLSFLLKNNKWLIKFFYTVAGLAPLIIAAMLSMDMRKAGLLYYGGDRSFYHITMASLSYLLYGDWCTPLAVAFIVLAAIGVIILGSGGIAEGIKNILFTNRWIFAGFFIGNIMATILLQKLMHVNYPEDRTAMYFYFFLILFICFGLDAVRQYKIRYLSLLWLVVPLHFLFSINLSHSAYWWYEHIPSTVFTEMKKKVGDDPGSATVGGYNLTDMVWAMHNHQYGGVFNDLQSTDYPSFYYDYLLLYDDENYQKVKNDYTEIVQSSYSHLRLLERKQKVKMNLVTSYGVSDHILDTNEYFNFYASDSLNRFTNLCFDIQANVSSPDGFIFANLTAGTFNGEEAGPHEFQGLHMLRSNWKGNHAFHHRICIPGISATASRTVCYLWNPQHQRISFTNITVTIYSWN
jgi:hypothetical protein